MQRTRTTSSVDIKAVKASVLKYPTESMEIRECHGAVKSSVFPCALTIAMLLLFMMVLGVVIVHAVRVLVLRMGLVVVMMMPMLIFPRYLLMVAYHWPGEMMERVRVVMTLGVSVAVYICGRSFFDVIVVCEQCLMKLYSRTSLEQLPNVAVSLK